MGGKYKGLLDKALETEAFEEDWYRWKYREKGLGESRALAKPVKSTPPAYTSVHSHMHKSHSHPSKRQKIVDDTADYLGKISPNKPAVQPSSTSMLITD